MTIDGALGILLGLLVIMAIERIEKAIIYYIRTRPQVIPPKKLTGEK